MNSVIHIRYGEPRQNNERWTGSYPIPEPDVVMTLECYMETGTDTSARTLRVYDIDGTIGSKMW